MFPKVCVTLVVVLRGLDSWAAVTGAAWCIVGWVHRVTELFSSLSLTCRRRVVSTVQLLLVSPMASLLRVVASSCSVPLFTGVASAKLPSIRTVKTPCLRFFRTHQALTRLASPGKCNEWHLWHERSRLVFTHYAVTPQQDSEYRLLRC